MAIKPAAASSSAISESVSNLPEVRLISDFICFSVRVFAPSVRG